MAEYKISVDLSGLMDSLVSPIDAVVLPTINQAVRAVAAETAYRWKDAVSKAKLWYGEKIPYQQSISRRSWKPITSWPKRSRLAGRPRI
jgi:hypothetical protein